MSVWIHIIAKSLDTSQLMTPQLVVPAPLNKFVWCMLLNNLTVLRSIDSLLPKVLYTLTAIVFILPHTHFTLALSNTLLKLSHYTQSLLGFKPFPRYSADQSSHYHYLNPNMPCTLSINWLLIGPIVIHSVFLVVASCSYPLSCHNSTHPSFKNC